MFASSLDNLTAPSPPTRSRSGAPLIGIGNDEDLKNKVVISSRNLDCFGAGCGWSGCTGSAGLMAFSALAGVVTIAGEIAAAAVTVGAGLVKTGLGLLLP